MCAPEAIELTGKQATILQNVHIVCIGAIDGVIKLLRARA